MVFSAKSSFKIRLFQYMLFVPMVMVLTLLTNQYLYSEDMSSSIDSYLSGKDSIDEKSGRTDESNSDQEIVWKVLEAQLFSDGLMKLKVSFNAQDQFSVFKDDLSFKLGMVEPSRIIYPKSFKRKEPISSKLKDSFKPGSVFEIYFQSLMQDNRLDVKYSACTVGKCLFPTVQTLSFKYEKQSRPSGLDLSKLNGLSNQSEKVPDEKSSQPIQPIQDSLENLKSSSDLNSGFSTGGILLFVLIFLAGLATNLTPCVAPMIPITVGVLVKSKRKFTPVFYAAGILTTYLVLGITCVYAGMMFGFLMSSPIANIIFSCFMFLIACSMLSDGGFLKLQNLSGATLKHTRGFKNENVVAFLKGTLAGGLAAPCTGPVLVALLAYIATTPSRSEGVGLIFTYAFGFSLPYVVLGYMSWKISRLKVSSKIQTGVKLVFASLMFALGWYYIRNIFYEGIDQIARQASVVLGALLLGLILVAIVLKKNIGRFKKKSLILGFKFKLSITLLLGSFMFFLFQTCTSINNIKWTYAEDQAVSQGIKEDKAILLDNWASWCESCHEVEKYIAKHKDKFSDYVLWKKDLSKESQDSKLHRTKYKVKGLPTLIVIDKDALANLSSGLIEEEKLHYFYDIKSLEQYLDSLEMDRLKYLEE